MAHIDFVTPTGNKIALSVVNTEKEPEYFGLCVHVNGEMLCGAFDPSGPVMRHSDDLGYRIAFWNRNTHTLNQQMPEIAVADEATARALRQIVHGYTPSFDEFWEDNAVTTSNRVKLYKDAP